jgi:transposase
MKELQPQMSAEDKDIMQKLLSAGQIKYKYAVRPQTVLQRANGEGTGEISDFLGIHPSTVSLYINRYNRYGIDSLLRDKTREPGKEPISQEKKDEIRKIVCTEKPKDETHWSVRTLARRVGVGKAAVNNILNETGLKPHLLKRGHRTKGPHSSDPDLEKKLKGAAGIYLNPPNNAVILCVDEKTQIHRTKVRALERMRPILPITRNVPERQSIDYKRHGTTTLFAALDVLGGNVIGECMKTPTSKDCIQFLKKVDRSCPGGKALHIVADNLSTHKTKEAAAYFSAVPGISTTHFIPTHPSWLNLVERWFAEITNKRIRRESADLQSEDSVSQLVKAIKDYIKTWNKPGRFFKWTKKPEKIITKITKAKANLMLKNV